jgi:hypothetical protein
MYNRAITDKQLLEAGKQANIKLVRYDDDRLDEMLAKLELAVQDRDKNGAALKHRQLNPYEQAFIKNERLVCKYDFEYFFKRYCHTQIKLQGQPVVVARVNKLLEPQRLFLEHLSLHEKALAKGKATDGYMFIACKARQEGYTTVARGITMHRAIFWEDTRALAASVDDTMVLELYDRDHTIYDNLPWWLKPVVEYDQKGAHFTFGKMKSSITYAQGNQKGGVGTGKTIPVNHITELGLWEEQGANPEKLLFDLDPTWPQSPDTFVLFESTSNGRLNFWFNFTMASVEGRTRFKVVFCPWYAEPQHNRKKPPYGWAPTARTQAMMETVKRTSPGYFFGKTIELDSEQAYWWEDRYEEFRGLGRTAYFLSNYPTTLEESFQVSGNRAFSVETIDSLRQGVKGAVPYEFSNFKEIGKIT